MSYTHTSRNPLAAANPLRSMVWNKPAHQVLGWTPRQCAEFEIARDRQSLATLEGHLIAAYAALGRANKQTGVGRYSREFCVAAAFRLINATRRQLRETRKSLARAEMALLACAIAA